MSGFKVKIVINPYNGILLNNKNKPFNIPDTMSESQNHYTELKKLDKKNTYCVSPYIYNVNLIYSDRSSRLSGAKGKGEKGT